ncbi:TetR/AcrR family transcriptional regulator [Actinomadura atramentaria]|uniref:TetR/AcrR family transcriptional regulator n=1 Tax=Actinomadura atramentaria TaxID=1990 RepID=UPI00039CEB02|nr:TetR family transcriptional regulator [Actinomadura atramentaria]
MKERLTRERIVDAAVAIAARGEPDGLTGRALGAELGVDRSAVWRHFPDKDALLLAVGDRLLGMAADRAADRVPAGFGPRERLSALAREVVRVYVAHPYVGAAVASRTTRGPGEFRIVEAMLAALAEVGLAEADVVRYYRMLADTVLAYAGNRAQYAVLPPDVRSGDERAWLAEYAALNPAEFPEITARARRLAEVTDDTVLDTLLEGLWLAVSARAEGRS